MFSFGYIWEIAEGEVSKLPWYYQVLFTIIVVVLVLLYALNRPIFDKWVKSHNVKSNRVLKIMLVINVK